MKRLILLSLLSLTYFFSFGGGPLTGSLVYFPGSGTLKPLGIHLYFNGFRLDSIYGSSQIPSDWNALSGPTRILNKPSFLSPEDTCSDQDNGHGPIIHCAFPGLIMTKYKADALYLPIGFTESDPLFASSPAYDITTNEISTWNNLNSFTGFGTDHSHAAYGDHSHRWLIDSISGFAGMVGKIKVDMPKYRLAFTLSTIPHGGPPPPYYFHDSLLFTEEHPTGYPNKIRLIAKGAIGTTAEIGSPQNPFDTLYTNHIYPPINTTDTSLDAVQHTLSGNNILRYGGNVGIGTNSSSEKLEVNGNAKIDGNIQLTTTSHLNNNGVIYKNGELFLHDFNYGDNGTVTITGNNTFLGIEAGNLTMGSTAQNYYEASNNVGIGADVLSSNTTGFGNIGMGTSALNNNTTGYYNMAMGGNALIQNLDGEMNAAIGFQSLVGAVHGSYNTGVGCMSLSWGTGGSSNTAIGAYASPRINGYYNTAIGKEALYNATGNSNVAIGCRAGFSLTTGDANILIGGDVNNDWIYADVPNPVTSNFLNIGNTIFGTGINQAYPTAGKIGINTISPSEKLEVNGNVKIDAVLKLTPIATPSNPTEGDIYAGTDHHLYYYNGSMWKQLDN